LLAQDFFRQPRTMETFGTLGCVVLSQNPAQMAQTLIAQASTIDIMELPPALTAILPAAFHRIQGADPFRPGPTPAPAPAPRGPSRTPGPPPGQPPLRPPPGRAPPNRGAPTGQQHQGPPQARQHPNPSQPLVAFFASLQNDGAIRPHQRRTRTLLQSANLTTEQALAFLGLDNQDCFNFHSRGSCARINCPMQHAPRAINQQRAQGMVDTLQQAVTHLRARNGPQ
jgi:hypothetical protein